MNNNGWTPDSPYVIKTGPNANKSLEYVLLHNPQAIIKMRWAANNMPHANTTYHEHLAWLVDAVEQLAHSATCSCCGQKATVIPVLGDHIQGYTIVHQALCAKCATQPNWDKSMKISLTPWDLQYFKSKTLQNRVWSIILSILGISKRIKDQKFFEILTTRND